MKTDTVHYEKSKLRAEKTAWEFVKKLDDEKSLNLLSLILLVFLVPLLFLAIQPQSASSEIV